MYSFVSCSFHFLPFSLLSIACILLIHSAIDGHLSHFHLRSIPNKTLRNNHFQVFMWTSIYISLEWILRIGTPVLYGRCMFNPYLYLMPNSFLKCLYHSTYFTYIFHIPTSSIWKFQLLNLLTLVSPF